MSVDPIDNDLIEKYLLGKLNDAEIRSFKSRLENDREFARKFRLISTFPELMSQPARLEYEKKLAETSAPVLRKRSYRFLKFRYLVWAVVITFIVTGILLLIMFIGTGNQKQNVVREKTVVPGPKVINAVKAPVKDTQAVIAPLPTERKEIREETDGNSKKAIQLLTPAEGMTFSRKEMIQFNWNQKTDSFTHFYIYSELNDHVVLWRGIRPGTREYKVPGNTLYPGKFYWYVGTTDNKRSFIVNE
jgi:hypothetical protein